MSLKYVVVVVKTTNLSERLYVFPAEIDHSDFFTMLHERYPGAELVSAGALSNYRSGDIDQVRLGGESYTLHMHSRPEDVELFRRLSNGY